MSRLYERIEALCREAGITVTAMCREADVSRASLSDLKQGRKTSLSAETLRKIAARFGVSVDYLLGSDDAVSVNAAAVPDAAAAPAAAVSEADIKFALFGGDGEITDEMYEEVKRFAAFIKEKYR